MASFFTIHPYTERDFSPLEEIENHSTHARWKEKHFKSEMRGPSPRNSYLKVAVSTRHGTRTIIGFICYRIMFEELYIMKVSVHPESRRKGVASSLIDASLAHGREAGATVAVLDVVLDNSAACRLYEKLGFRFCNGASCRKTREPLTMVKEL